MYFKEEQVMLTRQEIELNPDMILFEDGVSEELVLVALEKKPSLIQVLDNPTVEQFRTSFRNGYYNSSFNQYIEEFTKEDEAGFIKTSGDKATKAYLEVLESLERKLEADASLILVKSNLEHYDSPCLTHSFELDEAVLDIAINSKEKQKVNPLTMLEEITPERVQKYYDAVGKNALIGLSGEYQPESIKLDIVQKQPYDYTYVCFDKTIAKYYVENHYNMIQFLMVKSKDDAFYKERVECMLGVCGAALQFLEKPSKEQQAIAVRQNPMSLEFVKKPTEELCLLAISFDKDAVQFVEKKTKKICEAAGIPYVKPEKYKTGTHYLVQLSAKTEQTGVLISNLILLGEQVEPLLKEKVSNPNLPELASEKLKKLATVKELTDEQVAMIQSLKLETTNYFLEVDCEEEDKEA